jgi:hypothetical protein
MLSHVNTGFLIVESGRQETHRQQLHGQQPNVALEMQPYAFFKNILM